MDFGRSSGEPKVKGRKLKASSGSLLERERDVEEREGVEVGKQLREGASFLYFQKFLIITKRPSH